MKERSPERVEGLTISSERAYPVDRAPNQNKYGSGLNSMAEGQGEIPKGGGPPTPPQPQSREVVTSEQRWVKEQGLEGERREALGRGEITMGGSQEFTDLPHTGNATLDAIVNQVNSLTLEQRADLGSIERQLGRVERLVDEGRITGDEAREILNELGEWRRLTLEEMGRAREQGEGLRLLQNIRNGIERLSRDPPQTDREMAELREKIRDNIKELPFYSAETNAAIPIIVKDEEMSDYFLNRLISTPDSNPGSQYDELIDIYTRSTLTTFISAVREENPARAKKYGTIQEVRRYFHNMQLSLSQGNMDTFAQLATTINDEHFAEAVDHIGVPTVNRLYEEAFWSMGLSQKAILEAGDFDRIEGWVRERFEQLAENGVIENNKFGYPRPLKDWEKQRALVVGLNFFIIKIRGAELLASAAVATSGGARQWGSFKYESAVRLVNPVRYLIHKFNIGEVIGGQTMYLRLQEELEEANKDLNDDDLPMIGKIRRKLFETSTPLGKTGYETGWRVLEGYLSTLPLQVTEQQVRELEEEFARFKAAFPFVEGDPIRVIAREGERCYVRAGQFIDTWARIAENFLKNKDSKFDKDKFLLEKLKPIQEQVGFYWGLLLGMGDIPTSMKEKFWEKTARFMPLRIAYFIDPDSPQWRRIESKIVHLQELRILKAEEINKLPDEQFVEKFRRLQELTPSQGNILDWYDSLPESEKSINFTLDERAVIEGLVDRGIEEAEKLAGVAWPNTPFMEDTLFDINYRRLGTEFSRRRIGDAAAISKAGQELISIFGNPGMDLNQVLEHFEKTLDALDTPHGKETGQKLLFPFEKAYLIFRRKYDGWDRVPLVAGIRRLIKENQSDAQVYYGHTAPADDVDDERELTQVMARRGLLRRGGKDKYGKEFDSLLEKMRRELGARWVNLIFYLLKTFGPLILILLPYEFFKALRETKQ